MMVITMTVIIVPLIASIRLALAVMASYKALKFAMMGIRFTAIIVLRTAV